MNYDMKDDPKSPKSGTIDVLLIPQVITMLETKHTCLSQIKMIYDINEDPILQVSSQEPSMTYKSTMENRALYKLIIMLESLNLIFILIIKFQDDL